MMSDQYDMNENVSGLVGFSNSINLCECGNPEIFHKVIHISLLMLKEIYEDDNNSNTPKDELVDKFTQEDLVYTLLTVLDCFKLTEHGGSIYGSWLSSNGQYLVELYDKYGYDEEGWPDKWYER